MTNSNEPVYWTMKDGQKIDIDAMDIGHLRNTLKMIIRRSSKKERVVDIYPHDFNDTEDSLEFLDCGDDPWLWP